MSNSGASDEERSTNRPEFKYLLDDLYFRLSERDAWYDQAIKYLLYGNGSAVALTLGLIGALGARGVSVRWLWLPLPFFFAGIVAVGVAVYVSARCARKGRSQFREMLADYLNGGSYTKIFLALPDLPSKWVGFSAACGVSATSFGLGAAALTWIAATGPYERASLEGVAATPAAATPAVNTR